MATTKQWVFENVSGGFLSIKIRAADGAIVRAEGIRPGSVRPVREVFRGAGGTVDLDAAKANEDVRALQQAGRLKVYEREVASKVGNVGPLFNENDPEPLRVEKILAYRLKVKEAAKVSAPAAVPSVSMVTSRETRKQRE